MTDETSMEEHFAWRMRDHYIRKLRYRPEGRYLNAIAMVEALYPKEEDQWPYASPTYNPGSITSA